MSNAKVVWIKLEKGIRCRKHPTRKYGVKADVYYVLRFAVDGKIYQAARGWASEGMTLARARIELAKLKEAKRLGEGARSLHEKRLAEKAEKKLQEQVEEQQKFENMSVNDFWDNEYWPSQIHKTKATMTSERGLWRHWLKPEIGALPIAQISSEDLESVKVAMMKAGRTPATIKCAMAVVSQMWTLASKKGLVTTPSPTKRVILPKKDNKRQRFLTKEEARQLLAILAEKSPITHDMAVMALDCGLRFGEIAALTWADCDFIRRQILIRDPKARSDRYAFMTSRVYSILIARPNIKGVNLVFPDANGNRMPMVSNTYRRVANELFNQGVTDPRLRVCFHTLRHTFASWLVSGGVSLYEVKELMGHADFSMTQRYSHLSPEGLRAAVKILEN